MTDERPGPDPIGDRPASTHERAEDPVDRTDEDLLPCHQRPVAIGPEFIGESTQTRGLTVPTTEDGHGNHGTQGPPRWTPWHEPEGEVRHQHRPDPRELLLRELEAPAIAPGEGQIGMGHERTTAGVDVGLVDEVEALRQRDDPAIGEIRQHPSAELLVFRIEVTEVPATVDQHDDIRGQRTEQDRRVGVDVAHREHRDPESTEQRQFSAEDECVAEVPVEWSVEDHHPIHTAEEFGQCALCRVTDLVERRSIDLREASTHRV